MYDALYFMTDLEGRVPNRVQITTDGLNLYLPGVKGAFRKREIDYAMLQKRSWAIPIRTRSRPATSSART